MEVIMNKIYIWGASEQAHKILDCVIQEKCRIVAFIDNDVRKKGKDCCGYPIIGYGEISSDFDYIIIAVRNYRAILIQLEQMRFSQKDRLISFYDESNVYMHGVDEILIKERWRITLLENNFESFQRVMLNRLNNLKYEILASVTTEDVFFPKIGDWEQALNRIAFDGCSLIRFGDGEFEIMAGKERPIFQQYDPRLSARLREVIKSNQEKLLIAIADNYGNLDKYTEQAADAIREYMTPSVRKFHKSMLDGGRMYYDAYMFRCYLLHKEKKYSQKRAEKVKQIWNEKEIVVIEGKETRTGYGNDLLDNTKDIKRLLAPTRNAFSVYNTILEQAKKISKDKLILIALGPAGKVLAYDLFLLGYQVVDIGQMDMDYEWFKLGSEVRVPNSNKYVSEVVPMEINDLLDPIYWQQVIGVVE